MSAPAGGSQQGSGRKSEPGGPPGGRRFVLIGAGVVAALLIVWAVVAQPWSSGDAEPLPTVTVVGPTDLASDPEPEPTTAAEPSVPPSPDPATPQEPAPEGSEIIAVGCGEPFPTPTRAPQLLVSVAEVQERPIAFDDEVWGGLGALDVVLTNTGATPIDGEGGAGVRLVLVDASGTVVATDYGSQVAAEGYATVTIEPGDSFSLDGRLYGSYDACHPTGTDPLPPGDYTAYAIWDVYPVGGVGEALQQGQSGPVPVVIGGEPVPAPEGGGFEPLPGGVDASTGGFACGEPLSAEQPATGITLSDVAMPPETGAGGELSDVSLTLTTTERLAGQPVLPGVVLTQDGVVVSSAAGTDFVASWYASPGTSRTLVGRDSLAGCDYEPLPTGTYEAHPVVWGNGQLIARGPAQQLVIE